MSSLRLDGSSGDGDSPPVGGADANSTFVLATANASLPNSRVLGVNTAHLTKDVSVAGTLTLGLATAITTAISANTSDLAALTTTVGGHTTTLASHASSISTLTSGLATVVSDLNTLEAVTISAGQGLTGGGVLGSNPTMTLLVGQNVDNSIIVNANDVQLNPTLQTAISTNTSNVASLTTTVSGHNTSISTLTSGLAAVTPTTKGQLLTYGSAPALLSVGSDTHVLTADSTAPNGIKWAAAASSGHVIENPNGSPVTARGILAFSSAFAASDSGGDTTDLDLATAGVAFAKIADGSARSVLGRIANSTGVMASIAGGGAGTYLRDSGTALAFSAVAMTEVGSVTATRIPFGSGSNLLTQDASLSWDNTNKRMGTASHYVQVGTASSGLVGTAIFLTPTTGGTTIASAVAAGTQSFTLSNTSNVNVTDHVNLTIKAGGSSAGDASLTLDAGGGGSTAWHLVNRNQSSDQLAIMRGTSTYFLAAPASDVVQIFPTGSAASRAFTFTHFNAAGGVPAGTAFSSSGLGSNEQMSLRIGDTTAGKGITWLTYDSSASLYRKTVHSDNRAGLPELKLVEEGGKVAIFGAGSFGSGEGVISVADATTVPTTNPTGGFVHYSEGGVPKWRDSAGNVLTIGGSTVPLTSVTSAAGAGRIPFLDSSALTTSADFTFNNTTQKLSFVGGGYLQMNGTVGVILEWTASNKVTLDNGGVHLTGANVLVGSMAAATSSVGAFAISNGTGGSAFCTGGGQFEVIAGALYWRGTSTLTLLAPA